jgi:pyruvate dehydrogenase E2 component (dihydrolipoamide acetyltransferase)
MAGAEGIDLSGLAGTGPDGTVTREDVEAAIVGRHAGTASGLESGAGRLAGAAPPGAGGSTQGGAGLGQSGGTAAIAGRAGLRSEVIPHSALRRTIAERMSQSAFTAPHVTLMTEAEATNLVSARNQLNEELPAPAKFGYNAVLAALTARALREHPHLNARWEADGIHVLTDINIALAVDTERGLMTPVLRNVDRLGLSEIQRGFAGLAERALAGRAMPDDFEGGTFTLTNLGAAEVDGFTPIINPPQAAILGVGRIVEKPVARDGVVVIRPMVVLSLSFDHRIVDGGPAARFLQRMKQLVERPMVLLLG